MLKKSILFSIYLALTFFLSGKGLLSEAELPLGDRQLINLNEAWLYLENNQTDVNRVNQDGAWQAIDLPHTWNQWDVMDPMPGYRRDASWYKKEMIIPAHDGARYVLYFEGANISTEVYVNGQLAGSHHGGYVGFEIEITNQVKKGKLNQLLIRVDNGYNPNTIPSQKSDFFIYGGITRDLWLKIVPENYISSVQVSTPNVTKQQARTSVAVEVDYTSKTRAAKNELTFELLDPSTNAIIFKHTQQIKPVSGKEEYQISLPVLDNPKLWSIKSPNLYTLRINYKEDGQQLDQFQVAVGYRWYHFEPHGAFFLNGEKVLLRGTHRHEEHAGYGAAMPNELHRKDIEMIKDLGVNFLRLGHYPQDPEVYKACDELGIIVWDELPWCRGGMGGETWQNNTERLLREQIHQNYNHPSIFFWSLGNEIYWLPDFSGGDDEVKMNTFLKKLHNIAHELDGQRMTAIRKYYAGADLVDVFSPSIWSGWYAGVYTNYQATLTKNQKKYPQFLHMEYGGSSHVGRHTETPITGDGMFNEDDWAEVANQVNVKNIAKGGDWTENYIVDLFDWYLGVSEQQENFAGNAQWAFKDFGTPLRPENAIPYMNQKGLVDREGNPKDAYYVFKSYWSDEPFTYIESHTWTERRGPKDKTRNIAVFSNCQEVELLHNGTSLGVKKRVIGEFPACGLNWDVLFVKGKNHLVAQGLKDGKVITTDSLLVNYDFTQAEKADHIQLGYRQLGNGNLLIEAFMLDKNGQRVLEYERPLYFSKDGAGELLINYGTPTKSQIIQMANGYAAIEMIPAKKGRAIIEARNQDFKGSYLTINFDKKTQALLLTQPFEYDSADKTKVTGPYLSKNKITVPHDLSGQNKWIMFEGPVLENDKIAYRYYADSRHRFDIYGKTVSDLVMDTVSWNYHNIMNWGSDILKVGNSLGIGSPAIWYNNKLYTLSDCEKKVIEILKNQDKQSTVRTTFYGLKIENHQFDLIQDWSIKAGDTYSEISLKVQNGHLPENMFFATGIVKHLPTIETGRTKQYFYAMNWGKQSFHKENMGMAIMAKKTYKPEHVKDDLSHVYIFKNAKQEVKYRFMAAWERDMNMVKDEKGFKKLVEYSIE